MKKSGFQLVNQRLLSVSYALNTNYKLGTESIPLEIIGTRKITHLENNHAQVMFTIDIFSRTDSSKAPMKATISHEGEFSWDDSFAKDQIETLLKYNAPAILLSYDRSILSMLTAYSNLPVLLLPLINFVESEKDIENI
ncbi:MAG: protein-export chaperone SecB [Sphaerochaeta sp.]